MKVMLLQKQESTSLITKLLNQFPNIKAQTKDEFQPIEIFEKNSVVFDATLL